MSVTKADAVSLDGLDLPKGSGRTSTFVTPSGVTKSWARAYGILYTLVGPRHPRENAKSTTSSPNPCRLQVTTGDELLCEVLVPLGKSSG